jgi:hypothetical protein
MFTHNGIAGNVERTNTDKIRVWEPYGIEGGSSARRSVVYQFAKTRESIELSTFRVPQEEALARPIDTTLSFLRQRIPVRFIVPSSTQSRESIDQNQTVVEELPGKPSAMRGDDS